MSIDIAHFVRVGFTLTMLYRVSSYANMKNEITFFNVDIAVDAYLNVTYSLLLTSSFRLHMLKSAYFKVTKSGVCL